MEYTPVVDSNQKSTDSPDWINEVRPRDRIKIRTTNQTSWIESPVFEDEGSFSALTCIGVDLSYRDRENIKPILLKSRIEKGDKFELFDREREEWKKVQKVQDGIENLETGKKSELKYDSVVRPVKKRVRAG